MNQIDYSDINKFLTSIGLIIIGVAFLIPWYINQNLNLLLVDQETFTKTTESAQAILTKQQTYLSKISNWLPYLFSLIMIIGIVLICIGLYRWNNRQKVLNGIQDEQWKAIKAQNISIDEKRKQIENTEELKTVPNNEKENAIKEYIAIEDHIFLKLSRHYVVNYIVQQNIRIGQFEYDVILKSKLIQKRVDLILEIKYFKIKSSQARFLEFTRLFLMAVTNYEQIQQRYGVIPVLLLIFENANLMEETKPYRTEMLQLAHEIKMNKLRILYRLEKDIPTLNAPDLIEDKT